MCQSCDKNSTVKKRTVIVTDENVFSKNFPELLIEWDWDKNNALEIFPDKITKSNSKKVWWICKDCGYEWNTIISTRTKYKSGCPKCNIGLFNKYGDNYISINYPHLLKEWDYEKNNPLTPDKYKAFTNHVVWWICPDCGHSYQEYIYKRTKFNLGCKICRKKEKILRSRIVKCVNCGNDFDYKLDFGWNDSKKNHDKCKKCHEKLIKQRIENVKTKKELLKKTRNKTKEIKKLKNSNPELFKSLHPTKNVGVDFENILHNSEKKYYWICTNCKREMFESVSTMVKKVVCRKCVSKRASGIERKFYFFIESVLGENNVENTYNFTTIDNKKIEIDIYIHPLKLGIEYDGAYFHNNKHEADIKKTKILNSHGIDVIRIREIGLSKIREEDIIYNYKKNKFSKALVELFWYIQRKYKLTIEQGDILKNFLKQDLNNYVLPKEYLVYPLKKNSLMQKNPHLSKLWHYEKNHPLKPEMVSFNYSKKLWFHCKNCAEPVNALIYDLLNGLHWGLCKECSNIKRKTKSIVKNIIDFRPELINWFIKEKNRDYKTYGKSSDEKLWWRCPECGEEFLEEARVMVNKKIKNLCPNRKNHKDWIDTEEFYKRTKKKYSEKNKTITSRNKKLDIKYPQVLCQWDWDKNITTPDKVQKYDDILIWWKCSKCGHSWQETPFNRISYHENCPKCNPKYNEKSVYGYKFCTLKKTSLLAKSPKIAKDWDIEKNHNVDASHVSNIYSDKVFWKCHKCGHSWEESVYNRTRKDRVTSCNCPGCEHRAKPVDNLKKNKGAKF